MYLYLVMCSHLVIIESNVYRDLFMRFSCSFQSFESFYSLYPLNWLHALLIQFISSLCCIIGINSRPLYWQLISNLGESKSSQPFAGYEPKYVPDIKLGTVDIRYSYIGLFYCRDVVKYYTVTSIIGYGLKTGNLCPTFTFYSTYFWVL